MKLAVRGYHQGRDLMEITFGKFFSEAWGTAATVSTGRIGFRACRLYSANKHAVP
jgi:hypothetical protein